MVWGEKSIFSPLPISRVPSSFFCGTGISKQFVVVVRLFFRSRVMTMVRPHATAPPKKNPPPFRWNRPPRFTVMGGVGGGGGGGGGGPPLHTAGYKPDLNLSPLSSTEEEGAGETFFLLLPPRFFHFGSSAKTKTAAVALDGDRILR